MRRHTLQPLVLALCALALRGGATAAQETGTAGPSATGTDAAAPRLTAAAMAPVLIHLRLEVITAAPVAFFAVEQHGPQVDEPQLRVSARCEPLGTAPASLRCSGEELVAVQPDSTYEYRVAGHSVEVHSPAPPETSPAPPLNLRAEARSPFVVALHWDDGSANEYGFEVQRRAPGGEFEPVTLQNPNVTEFLHHGRSPEVEYVYRVRAFNAQGWSEFSNAASVQTPAATAAILAPLVAAANPAPCTTFDAAAIGRETGQESGRAGIRALTMVCHRIPLAGGHVIDAIASECGQNCGWTLYGDYAGCYRKLGQATQPGPCPQFESIAMARSGWPIVRELEHFTAAESAAILYAFVNGQYVAVDTYSSAPPVRCADWQGFYTNDCEPKDLSPPFSDSQSD